MHLNATCSHKASCYIFHIALKVSFKFTSGIFPPVKWYCNKCTPVSYSKQFAIFTICPIIFYWIHETFRLNSPNHVKGNEYMCGFLSCVGPNCCCQNWWVLGKFSVSVKILYLIVSEFLWSTSDILYVLATDVIFINFDGSGWSCSILLTNRCKLLTVLKKPHDPLWQSI